MIEFYPYFPYISVGGIIGAGKSKLVEELEAELKKRNHPVKAYMEDVNNNPYLGDYYVALDEYRCLVEDSKRYPSDYKDVEIEKIKEKLSRLAFEMQIYFMFPRYNDYQRIIWNLSKEIAIQDRSIFEDQLFVNILKKMGIIDERADKTYLQCLGIMSVAFRIPDLIIFLEVTPETGMERKKIRGRPEEQTLFLDYQAMLAEEYSQWAWIMDKITKVHFVDWNEPDQDIQPMVDMILELMPCPKNISKNFD